MLEVGEEGLKELLLFVARVAAAAHFLEVIHLMRTLPLDLGVEEPDGNDLVEGRLGETSALVVIAVGNGLDVEDEEVVGGSLLRTYISNKNMGRPIAWSTIVPTSDPGYIAPKIRNSFKRLRSGP